MTDAEVYAGAALMGAVAGMRSMSAPTIVSQFARAGLPVTQQGIGFLNSMGAARTTAVLAAGELIADKLPSIPSRTKTGSLIARGLSGGLGGAAVCSSTKRPVWTGALLGAVAAIGASFGMYELRRRAARKLHVPDPVLAVVEDAIAAGGGILVLSRLRAAAEAQKQIPAA